MKDISKRIKQLRQERSMTQEELAERLHVTRQAVSNWENKKTRPDVETLEQISKVFEMQLMDLLYGESSTQPTSKQLRAVAVFGVPSAICVLLWTVAVPFMTEYAKQSYRMTELFALELLTRLLSAAILPLVFALISLRAEIFVAHKKLRQIFLAAGALLAVLTVLFWLAWAGNLLFDGATQQIYRLLYPVAMSRNTCLVAGGMIYLGLKKREYPPIRTAES